MTEILKGAAAADSVSEAAADKCRQLRAAGVAPTLAIVRVGERADDLSYERGAMKRCAKVGIDVRNEVFDEDISAEAFYAELDRINSDASVHGILLFRPLPAHIDGERARMLISPSKDVDGCTDGSLAGVFTDSGAGFPPCTAQAVIEMLDHYGYDPAGRRAVVIGRSLVIGRPVAMMLMHRNATVTICHTKTADLPAVTKEAELLITASGSMESIGADHLRAGQTVIDVGISWNEEKGKLCGDVIFEDANGLVSALTPVPGGVGAVTTAVLAKHVVEAAEAAARPAR